jgi:hypothetical protein
MMLIALQIMAAPFENSDGFEMNATLYQDCIFIEEHHAHKIESRQNEQPRNRRGPPLEVMQFWGNSSALSSGAIILTTHRLQV